MMTEGVVALTHATPGDVVLIHWVDAHHGNETWYTWEEVAEYHEKGGMFVEQVGFFVGMSDTTVTLVSSHGNDGTNAPWNIPRAWLKGSMVIRYKLEKDVPWQ